MNAVPKIAIDAGHGVNFDSGAEATSKGVLAREDVIALDIAKKLKDICNQNNVPTIWCRPDTASSESNSLQRRVDNSNQGGANLYISIHFNCADPTTGARGTEAFAISSAAKALAGDILTNLAKFGWKNRGVKTNLDSGRPPYVISQTNAVAVLVEICFLDADVDRDILAKTSIDRIAQAIYDGIMKANQPVKTIPAIAKPAPSGYTTVLDVILNGEGSTSGVDGLSDQIIAQMGSKLAITKVSAPNFKPGENCDPYFQPAAAASLSKLLAAKPDREMICNSAYRTIARQVVLYESYRRGLGYINLAARPGNGDHEGCVAIDIGNWQAWKSDLENADWNWQGSNDPVHFSYTRNGNTAKASIAAFQELHNQNNPGNLLTVDGGYGENTRAAMLAAPGGGWLKAFNRSLYAGMSGIDVVELAKKLRQLGFYTGPIDHNRFENSLTQAVLKFQQSRGMIADSIAGRGTLLALFPEPNSQFKDFTGT
jgi:N-acetylmuramoyl-L-alanine amidase